METENEKKTRRSRHILILLLLVCLSPVLGSWWLVNFTDMGAARGQVNYGTLIQPPRPLPNLFLFNPASGTDSTRLHGKWSLVYLLAGPCDNDCEQNLYKMRQLEMATGKHSHRVQRVLLSYGGEEMFSAAEHIMPYERQLVAQIKPAALGLEIFALTPEDLPLSAGRLYIVDPLGNLMMSYGPKAEPAGIIKDLKRLLKYAKIG